MIIQHNMQAMNTERTLGTVMKKRSDSTKNLSSGYRINSAADDAAGLSISEKMRAQIKGLHKASTNSQDGVSLIQVADAALNEVHAILQNMNQLATQAANDTNTAADRDSIKSEIDQLATEIDRIAGTTEFNTMKLFDGTFKNKQLQVGANSKQSIDLDIKAMDTHGLGLAFNYQDPNIQDIVKANYSIDYIELANEICTAYYYTTPGGGTSIWTAYDVATGMKNTYNPNLNLFVNSNETAGITMQFVQNSIELVSQMRSTLGAVQNRLEHTISNVDNAAENLTASESKIRDTDIAKEMVAFSASNILAQAGQTMLAQANQNTQGVLALLQ